MNERTAAQTVQCAIRDFDSIRAAIIAQGESVPYKTPTSKYAQLIMRLCGRPLAGAAYAVLDALGEETIFGAAQGILQGNVRETVFGNAIEI